MKESWRNIWVTTLSWLVFLQIESLRKSDDEAWKSHDVTYESWLFHDSYSHESSHDAFVYVQLDCFKLCDVTNSCVTYDSFICDIYMWCDEFMCDIWLFHMWHIHVMCLISVWQCLSHVWHMSHWRSLYETCLIPVWHSHVWHIHVTNSRVTYDSFICDIYMWCV